MNRPFRNPREASPTARKTAKYKFKGHKGSIRSFVFLQDNNHIVSGSWDCTMRKWDCETGLLVGEPWKGQRAALALALSPNGEMIACGRDDGNVERWDTNGEMKDIWRGHGDVVWSLSWSHCGSRIASGSSDGTIIIRNAKSGQVEVGPIETDQHQVRSLAYSPSGDRVASGGSNQTICIWDSQTSKLLVGPLQGLRDYVWSVVWSWDGSKLYSASDAFARVFDSTSGAELHRFQHSHLLNSIALSPKYNLLACVGDKGVAQLWDTESYQPLSHPFHQEDRKSHFYVSFSPDGQYLAYGGENKRITLWAVKDIAHHLPVPASSTDLQNAPQERTLAESPSSSYLDVDATNPFGESGVTEIAEGDDPYNNFFSSSQYSIPSPSSSRHRMWHVLTSLLHLPTNESMRFHERLVRRFFSRRTPSNSALYAPANSKCREPTPKRKYRASNEDEEHRDVYCSVNITPETSERSDDKGKQQQEPIARTQAFSSDDDPSFPTELERSENRAVWRLLMRARKKDSKMAPAKVIQDPLPSVVEVSACRVPQVYVAYKRKPKKKSPALMTSVHPTAAVSDSLQAGSSSIIGDARQVTCANGTTMDDWDSDSIIQGRCNIFLDKICFPCGHYKEDA